MPPNTVTSYTKIYVLNGNINMIYMFVFSFHDMFET